MNIWKICDNDETLYLENLANHNCSILLNRGYGGSSISWIRSIKYVRRTANYFSTLIVAMVTVTNWLTDLEGILK